jgi:hypothetical protein
METITYQQALKKLTSILDDYRGRPKDWQQINNNRDEVLARYQPIFTPKNLPSLSFEDFGSFLLYENNKHWRPIYRQKNQITADMDLLRGGLLILTDETHPIQERMDLLRPPGKNPMIKGLSRAVLTPILLIVYPEQYGVWNNTSESGMKKLNILPDFPRGASFGERYAAVNQLLLRLRDDLDIDLWILDKLWWQIDSTEEPQEDQTDKGPGELPYPDEFSQGFGLEKHLQMFIVDNWDSIEIFKEWSLLEEDDELVGVEYNTQEIGRIDLLAKHKTKPEWLVIELKRDQSSDQTVEQVLRYMGWVQQKLASSDDKVFGLIISRSTDDKVGYALRYTQDVDLMFYEVQFTLHKA